MPSQIEHDLAEYQTRSARQAKTIDKLVEQGLTLQATVKSQTLLSKDLIKQLNTSRRETANARKALRKSEAIVIELTLQATSAIDVAGHKAVIADQDERLVELRSQVNILTKRLQKQSRNHSAALKYAEWAIKETKHRHVK